MDSWSCFQGRICSLYCVDRSAVRRETKMPDTKQEITELLMRLADSHKRWGFGLMLRWLRRQGYAWNHKRVYKIYCELALNLRIKPKNVYPLEHLCLCINQLCLTPFGLWILCLMLLHLVGNLEH